MRGTGGRRRPASERNLHHGEDSVCVVVGADVDPHPLHFAARRAGVIIFDAMAIRGAGGTPGGIGQFFLGLAMMAVSAYLFLGRVVVMSNMDMLFGHAGLVLVPLGMGVAMLFFNARSILGWLLAGGSVVGVLVSILMNLTLFFQPTSFVRTTLMMSLLFVGLIMMLRSFRPARL